jgi:hypothetical protein
MPKRTNAFQDLVALVQRALAPVGAKVTESAMVSSPWMTETREIDILIEAPLGIFHIKIAVEAKDEGRKMDSTKFESLLGKYHGEGGVKVDKVVIITHHGFFKPVIERAKRLGIDLYTLEQAFDVDWAALFPQTMRFSVQHHLCGFEVEPAIPSAEVEAAFNSGEVVCSHRYHGTLMQFASSCVSRDVLPRYPALLAQLDEGAQLGNGDAKTRINLELDHPYVLRFSGKEYPLTVVRFDIHRKNGEGKMHYSTCRLTSTDGNTFELQCAQTEVAGKRITMMMPDGLKSKQIVVKIEDA